VHRVRILVLLAALIPATASAQLVGEGPAPILLPGSLNFSAGTLAPGERDNVLGQVTVEQGFTIAKWGPVFVVGFADVGARHDTEGLGWNRATTTTAGLKIGLLTRFGVLQAAAGAMSRDVGRGRIRVEDAAYVTYWNGWRADAMGGRSDDARGIRELDHFGGDAAGRRRDPVPPNLAGAVRRRFGGQRYRGVRLE
jgi:hypothetical protein